MLLKWSSDSEELATWEDLEAVKQKFPRAPAWGQAGPKQGGIVSDQADHEQEEGSDSNQRPIRKPRLPAWLVVPEWAMGLVRI